MSLVCIVASGMKVKQTVDKMATVADSLSEGGTVHMLTLKFCVRDQPKVDFPVILS